MSHVMTDTPAFFVQEFERLTAGTSLATLRVVERHSRWLGVKKGVAEPPQLTYDRGWMLSVVADERGGRQGPCGIGYAASADFTAQALAQGLAIALAHARLSARHGVCDFSSIPYHRDGGDYAGPDCDRPVDLRATQELLRSVAAQLQAPQMIHSLVSLAVHDEEHRLYTAGGGCVRQRWRRIQPGAQVTVQAQGLTQRRSWNAGSVLLQGGTAAIENSGFAQCGAPLLREALSLLTARPCPDEEMDLILMPDQMHLQIHESIGHPLELDRILGDERNYAGTSFVTQEMFGRHRYGSDLLNVSFDPGLAGEAVSCAFDDEGTPARKVMLIERGILKNPLGALSSQVRSGLGGTANARAQTWNRPPMDRMGNINLEPGTTSFERMIEGVERGVLLSGNRSWSIDDSRNKFQFGCEYGRLIENGRLGEVVRDANYRGISSSFWRSLKAVGDAASMQVLGVSNCGKGELNQVVTVGHASPPCLFSGIRVFAN